MRATSACEGGDRGDSVEDGDSGGEPPRSADAGGGSATEAGSRSATSVAVSA